MRNSRVMHLYAIGTILLWATAFPITRIVGKAMDPIPLGTIRCTAAAVLLIIVGMINRIRLPKTFKDGCLLALAGACGFGFYMIFFNTGIMTLTSATSSIVIATTPVMTALAASRGDRQNRTDIQRFFNALSAVGADERCRLLLRYVGTDAQSADLFAPELHIRVIIDLDAASAPVLDVRRAEDLAHGFHVGLIEHHWLVAVREMRDDRFLFLAVRVEDSLLCHMVDACDQILALRDTVISQEIWICELFPVRFFRHVIPPFRSAAEAARPPAEAPA